MGVHEVGAVICCWGRLRKRWKRKIGNVSSKYNVDMYEILKESRQLKNRLSLHDVSVGNSFCCPIIEVWLLSLVPETHTKMEGEK